MQGGNFKNVILHKKRMLALHIVSVTKPMPFKNIAELFFKIGMWEKIEKYLKRHHLIKIAFLVFGKFYQQWHVHILAVRRKNIIWLESRFEKIAAWKRKRGFHVTYFYVYFMVPENTELSTTEMLFCTR